MPKINKILEVHLSLDESLVGDDKIVWLSSFYDTPKFSNFGLLLENTKLNKDLKIF